MAEDRKSGSERFQGKDTGTRHEDHRRIGESGAGYDYRGDFGRGTYGAGAGGGYGDADPDRRSGDEISRQSVPDTTVPNVSEAKDRKKKT